MQGVEIKSKELNQSINQIEIGDLPTGLYVIKLFGDNKVLSEKILKK